MTTTLNSAMASLSARLREQPGSSTFTVSREELNAIVGTTLNDARRRKERAEKERKSLDFMATISPHVLNFLAPILRGPRELSMSTPQWLNYGGVSVARAAGGGCIVAATNCKTMAIAYDAEATLTTPDDVPEMRFMVPDCILDACRPPAAPKLIAPGREAEELPRGICDLTVPKMVYASGAGIFVTPAGNPSEYSDGDEDGCDEWPEGGVLATSPVSIHEISDARYCLMETRGAGTIADQIIPIMRQAQENFAPLESIGMGTDATNQMAECMDRILEWINFDAFRVNEGKPQPEKPCIGYGNLGWKLRVSASRNGDPLKARSLTYLHGSGRYILIQCEYKGQVMPDTPKEGWFTPESKGEGE